jgi:hypothetical protein
MPTPNFMWLRHYMGNIPDSWKKNILYKKKEYLHMNNSRYFNLIPGNSYTSKR